MSEQQTIENGRPPGKYLTDCRTCGVTFGVNAKHMVRQRARCRPCIRTANGWTCPTCGTADPHHPSPCPTSSQAETRDVPLTDRAAGAIADLFAADAQLRGLTRDTPPSSEGRA